MLFNFFILCSRLLILTGLAATNSKASRIFTDRAKYGKASLVGKALCPGSGARKVEQYWAREPMDSRLVPHNAAVANIGVHIVNYARLLKPTTGVIPDLLFELNGTLNALEYETNETGPKKFSAKIDNYVQTKFDGVVWVVVKGDLETIEKYLKGVSKLPEVVVASLEDVVRIGPFAPVWRVPGYDRKFSLSKNKIESVETTISPAAEGVLV